MGIVGAKFITEHLTKVPYILVTPFGITGGSIKLEQSANVPLIFVTVVGIIGGISNSVHPLKVSHKLETGLYIESPSPLIY